MKDKIYIKNTMLLFAAMAVTKIVGAIFKIPLANILGGTGMGYFSAAYSLYSPVFAVTAAGIPTVLMRQTAKNIAAGRCANADKIKHISLLLFTAVGTFGMCLIWVLSGFFSEHIAHSPQSRPAIVLIAPAVLFCCIASVYRGYYEGRFNVFPTALANVTEAVSRAVVGLAVSYGILIYSKYCYTNGNSFMDSYYTSYAEAYEGALPVAAAGAILAVTLSEICGLVALLLHDRRNCGRSEISGVDNTTDSARVIIGKLLHDIVPIAVFALVMNCFSFIDLLTVTRSLDASFVENGDYYRRVYTEVFASGISSDEFANFAYGSYTGIAMSLFMLIPSFAGMTEKTSIPEITSAWEKQDQNQIAEKTSMLFKASVLIGAPACLGAAAMAQPILSMLYSSRSAEISICLSSFIILCMGGIFMVMSSALSGFFQAVGRPEIPLWLMSGAVILKAIANPMLISIPQLNISGAAAATVLSYLFVFITGMIIMRKMGIKINILSSVSKILLCACGCAAAAKCSYILLRQVTLPQPAATIFAVLAGAFVYVILLIMTGVFRTSPIIKSEKQKKYRKGLEKS